MASLGPEKKLPHGSAYSDEEAYVHSLMRFVTQSTMLQSLCGGLHILDFMTRKPDLYETILPQDWRDWLESRSITSILDLFMRDDIDKMLYNCSIPSVVQGTSSSESIYLNETSSCANDQIPPMSLLQYIKSIRDLSLDRRFPARQKEEQEEPPAKLSRQISVGMKPKKAHEVQHFAAYIDNLTSAVSHSGASHAITHLVDFGSGQNYLGRTLASPVYRRRVIAVESKQNNIDGAKSMDVTARLAKRSLVMRNKKAYRARLAQMDKTSGSDVESDMDHSRSDEQQYILQRDEEHEDSRLIYMEHVISDGKLDFAIRQLSRQNIPNMSPCSDFPDGLPRE